VLHKTKKRAKRDPLKQSPLPQPGDSIEDEISHLVNDTVVFWVLAFGAFACVTVVQWIAWIHRKPINPALVTLITAVVAVMATLRIGSAWKRAKSLRLGARGERVVGQRLETLRPKGYKVFHDILGDAFNIDHVLIGPGGVFVIETKTISKPVGGEAAVTYDGRVVLVNGRPLDRDPIRQAEAGADFVRRLLEKATGRRPSSRPVVLFPDWWVEKQPRGVDVWVLNPDAFAKFLDHEPPVLSAEDVALLSMALETHIRASR
jgi:hypothetical protein